MKFYKSIILALISFFITNQSVFSTTKEKNVSKTENTIEEKIDYSIWEALLSSNVDENGNVNYDGFIADRVKFDTFLNQLCATNITIDWTKNDKMAYWINVYNAFTIKLIIDNYPTKSIKDISSPWKQKFFNINDQEMNLSGVEHDILRKEFNDPRIHFAINCASASCPPVLNQAYLSKNLETLLEQQTKKFINNTKYNKISADRIELSKIFDWYKNDFKTDGNKNVIDYINKYSDIKISENAKKSYLTYDWNLNKKL